MKIIYTPAGEKELKLESTPLSTPARRLLAAIGHGRRVSQLARYVRLGELDTHLSALYERDLIEVIEVEYGDVDAKKQRQDSAHTEPLPFPGNRKFHRALNADEVASLRARVMQFVKKHARGHEKALVAPLHETSSTDEILALLGKVQRSLFDIGGIELSREFFATVVKLYFYRDE